jgi:hypothetical protein
MNSFDAVATAAMRKSNEITVQQSELFLLIAENKEPNV